MEENKEQSRKINIGFLIHNIANHGGTERVTVQIANGLSKSGYKAYIFSCREGRDCNYDVSNEVEQISLEGEKYINPLTRKLKMISELKCQTAFMNIDVMIAVDVMLYPYVYILQKKGLCKGIAWEHFNYYGKETFGKYIRKLAAKKADTLIVLSKHDKKNYEENCRKINKIEQIYNPVTNCPNFMGAERENIVLSVGRLEDQKGYDMLIESWKKVERECPDWKLVIVGRGSKEEELRKSIELLKVKNVKIEPFTKNIWEYYTKAKLYVMSSRYEGFPLVLIEAQAAGLPIISFDCKEGPAEIISDGVNGYLVPEGRTDIMTGKIIEVLKNPELRLQFESHTGDDLDRYSEANIILEWDGIIRSLVGVR